MARHRRILGIAAAAAAATGAVATVLAPRPASAGPDPDDIVGDQFHVAPRGTPDGDGTVDNPWDLATALAHPAAVGPGDVIWLAEGEYHGQFISSLVGSEDEPIIVSAREGERAVIDARDVESGPGVGIMGSDTWFWGLEFTNSLDAPRSFPPGDEPGIDSDRRAGGVYLQGPRNRLINNVIHDGGSAIGVFGGAEASESYGNIVYYAGWVVETRRGHGEAVYSQNNGEGTIRLVDNWLFRQFDNGIIVYGSSDALIDNFVHEGNVLFENGMMSSTEPFQVAGASEMLIGGGNVAHNHVIRDNACYNPADRWQTNCFNLAYELGSEDFTFVDNYAFGPVVARWSTAIDPFEASGNTLIGELLDAAVGQISGAQNDLHPLDSPPATNHVSFRPNQYERGRANIAVFNWEGLRAVTVDIGGAQLEIGEPFEVRDVQDYFAAPLVIGAYDGRPISIPTTSTSVAAVVGSGVPRPPEHTASEFGTFVLQRCSLAHTCRDGGGCGGLDNPACDPGGGTTGGSDGGGDSTEGGGPSDGGTGSGGPTDGGGDPTTASTSGDSSGSAGADDGEPSGCGCHAAQPRPGAAAAVLIVALAMRRRRTRRAEPSAGRG